MNKQDQSKLWKRRYAQLIFTLVVITLVSFFIWYRPKFFSFHSNISAVGNHVSGEVFRSSDGIFVVRLNSGSQLTVEVNPPRVFLSPKSTRNGIRVGRYLIIPAASVGGVDLSKGEGFGRQMPVINQGKITLKDPMQQDSVFYFPSES